MKPLIVLLVAFIISLVLTRMFSDGYQIDLSGRIAMSAMLIFTAIGHFAFSKGMALMIPRSVPFKLAIVYVTGVLEIVAAIGLLIPGLNYLSGWFLVCFFILLLPANVKAAISHLDYQTAERDGSGPNYLWFRIPLQILFIIWVYMFAVNGSA